MPSELRGSLLLCLALLGGEIAGGAANPVEIVASLSAREVFLGDPVTVVINAGGSRDWDIQDVELATVEDDIWRVLIGPKLRINADTPAWELCLAAMGVGELPLPPLLVTWESSSGERASRVVDQLGVVVVKSVLPIGIDRLDLAKGLRPPMPVSGMPWEWLAPALAVLTVPALAFVVLWRTILRHRRSQEGAPPTPEQELEELLEVLHSPLGDDTIQVRCDLLARGVRGYVERVTPLQANEMTSTELLLALAGRLSSSALRALKQTLEVADTARFGRRVVIFDQLHAAASTLEVLRFELGAQQAVDDNGTATAQRGDPA